MTIIQHAVWLHQRFPLSYRDVQELSISAALKSVIRPSENGVSSLDRSSLKIYATGNLDGVPGGI